MRGELVDRKLFKHPDDRSISVITRRNETSDFGAFMEDCGFDDIQTDAKQTSKNFFNIDVEPVIEEVEIAVSSKKIQVPATKDPIIRCDQLEHPS